MRGRMSWRSRRAAPAEEPSTEVATTDEKLKLITWAYGEVLDATKHQDDKIGRVLTSVAFLTAATLALASLSSARFVTRRFDVSPFVLPLGLITLVIFLVGVAFTVMLLLTSLATPLRLPGMVTSKHKHVEWAKGVRGSQLYFYEIAGLTANEWARKWSAAPEELKKERLDSLVIETRNLADRTNSKYDRTTEAAALLSLALLAFALAVIFVAIAANTPSSLPIHLTIYDRAIIGVVIGGFCGLQLLVRTRYDRQSIDDTEPDDEKSRVKYRLWGGRFHAIFLPLLLIDVLIGSSGWHLSDWIAMTALLGAANIVSYWFATWPDLNKGSSARWLHLTLMIIVTAALTSLAAVSEVHGWYAGQLGATSLAVLTLITIWVLGPTLIMADRRQKMRDRRAGKQARETSVETTNEARP